MVFRQLRGESPEHTAIRADHFDPGGWQFPEIAELCQNNDQGVPTIYVSAIAHMHQRRRCTNDNTPAGDNDAASTHCRLRKATELQDLIRQTFLRHRLGVRVGNNFLYISESSAGSMDKRSRRPAPRRLTGSAASRDEELEEQSSEPSGGPVGAWQSFTERQPVNSVEEGAERLRSSMRALREPGAAHSCDHGGAGFEDNAEQSHSALFDRKRPVEIERPFCPHGHGSMMMQATPQQSLHWDGPGRASFPFTRTRPHASERAGAAEMRGPEDLLPVRTTRRARAETKGGIESPSDGVLLRS